MTRAEPLNNLKLLLDIYRGMRVDELFGREPEPLNFRKLCELLSSLSNEELIVLIEKIDHGSVETKRVTSQNIQTKYRAKADYQKKASKDSVGMPEVVNQILSRCDHARLLELYYWSQEPWLLEIIRAVAGTNDAAREALQSFFALGGDPQHVNVTWASTGKLYLESLDSTQISAVAQYVPSDDLVDRSRASLRPPQSAPVACHKPRIG